MIMEDIDKTEQDTVEILKGKGAKKPLIRVKMKFNQKKLPELEALESNLNGKVANYTEVFKLQVTSKPHYKEIQENINLGQNFYAALKEK